MNLSRAQKSNGFTLIEVLVVVGLIVLIVSVAIPNAKIALKVNISNSSREIASFIHAVYDESILKGKVYRIAFDIDKAQYWAEIGEQNFLMLTGEQEEKKLEKQKWLTKEEKDKQKDPFVLARSISPKHKNLPKGVHFTRIQNSRSNDPQKEGIVYAHVFPHGFIEKLIVHLKDDFDRAATLVVNPVNGTSKLYQRDYDEERK